MRLLLHTHALLWWLTDDARLSATAREALADAANEVFVSAASAWEIATKQRLGKLHGVAPVAQWFDRLLAEDGFVHLPIGHLHALRAGATAGRISIRSIACWPPRPRSSSCRWSRAMQPWSSTVAGLSGECRG
ncbi:hypothetical protein MASR1M6_06240 [Rubrivivax sp.]|jgi:PIN domain nuclease of toxin-antitoxin system